MALKQIMFNTPEHQKMIDLRFLILRQPLNLSFSEEEIKNEENDILLGSIENGEINACCILTKIDKTTLQLRQMAVANSVQGKGVGAMLMIFAENISRDRGYKKIILHSRDTAMGFYEKFGYTVFDEPYLEVGIPHHSMKKNISSNL